MSQKTCLNPSVNAHPRSRVRLPFRSFLLGSALLVSGGLASSQSEEFDILALETQSDNDSGLQGLLTSNLRWTIDLASRATASTSGDPVIFENFIGFDAQKVFSGPSGDWGTLTTQFYLTRIDSKPRHPYVFEDDDSWALITRITNFNYTGLSNGQFNIKVGHFEIPYGVEGAINSNGTLRQLLTVPNLGIKGDWGVTINGVLEHFRYEVSLSRGSGFEIRDDGDPFIVAGRIGTPTDTEGFVGVPDYGISFFHGKVFGPPDPPKRTRIGLDGQWYFGPIGIMAEVSVGRDDDTEVVNALAEVNWQNPEESLVFYVQNRLLNRNTAAGWDEAISLVEGVRFTPNNNWAFSAQFEQQLSTMGPAEKEAMGSLQLRYRF